MSVRNIKKGKPISVGGKGGNALQILQLSEENNRKSCLETPRFLFCIPIPQKMLPEKGCCTLFTLRTGLLLIALWDLITALVNIFIFITEDTTHRIHEPQLVQIAEMLYFIMMGLALIPSLLQICFIRRGIYSRTKCYYYYKIIEVVINSFSYTIFAIKLNSQTFYLTVIGVRTLYSLYFLLIIFAYAVRIDRGEEIIVNNGREVVMMMADVQKQVGNVHPLSVPGVEVSGGITLGEDEIVHLGETIEIS